jgi:tetrapyrrole methylase family protein/MazG family protein
MELSLVLSAFDTLSIAPPPQLTLIEAQSLSSAHYPPFPPDLPALLTELDSRQLALQVKQVLLANYPPSHQVQIVSDAHSRMICISELGREDHFSQTTSLFIPAFSLGTSLEAFAEIVAHLRAPDGCPWDQKQTHQTLRKHLLEETYETLAAMDENDSAGMSEEFGDLLLQIVLNSQIASETGQFSMTQVLKGIYDKIVRRHPHVFGDLNLNGVDGVLQNWEKIKEQERSKNGTVEKEKGLLDGVPFSLPALTQALEYQDRAAHVGFDWNQIDGVLEKIREEVEEIKQAETIDEVADELGDLFFALTNLARWRKVDPESALRGTNMKFKKRFSHIEQSAKKQGKNLSDMTLEEMDALWNEAKILGL